MKTLIILLIGYMLGAYYTPYLNTHVWRVQLEGRMCAVTEEWRIKNTDIILSMNCVEWVDAASDYEIPAER